MKALAQLPNTANSHTVHCQCLMQPVQELRLGIPGQVLKRCALLLAAAATAASQAHRLQQALGLVGQVVGHSPGRGLHREQNTSTCRARGWKAMHQSTGTQMQRINVTTADS